jgi:hypothetical protein
MNARHPVKTGLRLRRLRRLWLALPLGLLVLAGMGACGGDGGAADAADVIDRETFISTYVMLRQTALSSSSGEISAADRDRILTGANITSDDMETFVAVHGDDPLYMRGVWDEVERRMRVLAGEIADTVG